MTDPVQTSLYIDGEMTEAHGGKTYPIYNPANPDHLVGKAADASQDDVDRAIAAAKKAHPDWSGLGVSARTDLLKAIAQNLKADEAATADLARQFTTEHGKVLFESTLEINRLADRFMQVASFAPRLAEEEEIKGPAFDTLVTRTGRGVTTLIVPWNWPLAILGSKTHASSSCWQYRCDQAFRICITYPGNRAWQNRGNVAQGSDEYHHR